jgi:NAD(P)-dependent dehydrogenase (short-subunit alcohol dehydrogenase family)
MTDKTDAFSMGGATAMVIGGSSGIGRAIALGMRAAGARVLIAARGRERLDAVAAELGADATVAYCADLRAPETARTLAERAEREHGPIDVLVNCQGTTTIKPALEVDEAEYDAVMDTNVKAVFFACTAFGARMTARGSGAIVNIASLAAHSGWSQAAAYCASKWAVTGLTQTLAAEWGGRGVRVNAIAPGFFLTDLNRDKMPPERKAEAIRRCAMGRMGDVSELVGAAVFLASPAARFVNGATLRVDGGYLASGI